MSTEADGKNIGQIGAGKNGWDQDDADDNWDDWGDAEDNFDHAGESKQLESTTACSVNNNVSTKANTVNKNSHDFNVSKQEQELATEYIPKQTAGWGGLFGGVVSSVLSTASDLTSTVSQGLNQVIGVPDPEELVRMQAESAAKLNSDSEKTTLVNKMKYQTTTSDLNEHSEYQEQDGSPAFGLSIVNGVTTLGTKVLNTGLDTLEGIGKKTMHILQENDPLLMNKRKLLGLESERPNLSEVLKEAKKDADNLESTLKALKLEKSREMLRFDLLFENHCGLVHLEALEILSNESTLKLQKLLDAVSGNALIELKETVDEVRELMELEDLEGESDGNYDSKELNSRLTGAVEDADLAINFEDIVNHWTIALQCFDNIARTGDTNELVQETFARGITMLAEACALQISKLHKIAELLLVKDHHSTANEVDCIVQLCKQFNIHLNGLTNRFAKALTSIKLEEESTAHDEVKSRISTLFAELVVATQHIENAFNLFLPVLQIGAV